MNIEHNFSLKNYNTFGIDAKAKHFCSISSKEELSAVLNNSKYPDRFILGGGSNLLLTKDIQALVMHINLKGITVLEEKENTVFIKCMAGENWHDFVQWTLANNYGGLENLSLIPGNVGTSPIQNIGAYGVELKDSFINCTAVEIATGKTLSFDKNQCEFGYRNSIFKNEAKGKYIITSVTFQLSTKNHELKTSYGAITEELNNNNIGSPTPKDVSNAVIKIRNSKLPDPKKLGNSGSFFKNPVVDAQFFKKFNSNYPQAPYYKISDTTYKIPAGWIIEQCGFKGIRIGDAGVHKMQALVLVNYGNATGDELWSLALEIQQKAKTKFNIDINPEVNII